jgi:N-acetylglucosaminyldiphosphoundecaprenol N-acetyl-beta-D-mannosaminyltransferase
MKRIELFGVEMDIGSMQETVSLITERIEQRIFTQHAVVNVAKIVNMRSDSELATSVRSCDIVNIDGMGVVWGARLLGTPVSERVAGIDLFDCLLKVCAERDFPVFFLGATKAVVECAASAVIKQNPALRIAGFHHGYFWDDEERVVDLIRSSGARLLFVAITSPHKENFINRWRDRLGVDFVMGVGGTFDVISGKVRRAPRWMQRCGLEWLFRVIQEPRRMWRRYFRTNLLFAWMLLKTGVLPRLMQRWGSNV